MSSYQELNNLSVMNRSVAQIDIVVQLNNLNLINKSDA